MATEPQEMADLTRIAGAVLINIGTLREDFKTGMFSAGEDRDPILAGYGKPTLPRGHFANANKKPIVFDPVGVGATAFRRQSVKG